MTTGAREKKLAFVANGRDDAETACAKLHARYNGVPVADADIIVALGGDGLMLQTLHKCLDTGTPIFGMNYGSIGFLMNPFEEENLQARIAIVNQHHADQIDLTLSPLQFMIDKFPGDGSYDHEQVLACAALVSSSAASVAARTRSA